MTRMQAVLAIMAVALLLLQPAVIAKESCGEDGGESHLTQTCQRPDGDRGGVTDEAKRAPGAGELGGQGYKSVKHFDESRKRRKRKGPEGEALMAKGYGDRRHRKKKKEGDIARENKNEGNKLKGRYSDLHKDKQEGDGFSEAEISNKKVKKGKNGERKHEKKLKKNTITGESRHKKNTMTGESRHTEKHTNGEKNKEYKSNRDQTKKNEHKHRANTKDKKNVDKIYKNMKSKGNKKNAGKKEYNKEKQKTAEDLNREEETNTEDGGIENIKNKIRVNRKAKDKIQIKVQDNVFGTPESVTENEIDSTEGITERARQETHASVATGNPDIDAEKQVTWKAKVVDERKTSNTTINSEEEIGSDAVYDESLDAEGKVPENVVDVADHAGQLKNAGGNIDEVTDGESSNDVTDDFVVAHSHDNYVDSLFVNLEFDSSELLGEELKVGTVEENKKEQEMTCPEVADQESEISENGGNDDQKTEGEEVDRKDGGKKVYEVSGISETEVESDARGPKTADGNAGDDGDLLMSPELGSKSDQETVATDVTAKDNHQEDVVVELGDSKGSE